ncbi:MAG: hypothetical protein HSCHL_1689 [Hydrogenibacillus schlegelii]|uniref:Uncharacterized protein n=1 Tax=Hydrogenibacillus schlegelii TaxID=1484 RepID=A0A2T5GBQ5_HYDSH|nr:MAG: hypothetical protein HSCHL_1689 [Hydrogenibacillus schlegelii]
MTFFGSKKRKRRQKNPPQRGGGLPRYHPFWPARTGSPVPSPDRCPHRASRIQRKRTLSAGPPTDPLFALSPPTDPATRDSGRTAVRPRPRPVVTPHPFAGSAPGRYAPAAAAAASSLRPPLSGCPEPGAHGPIFARFALVRGKA